MPRQPEALLCIDIDGTLIDSHEKVHPTDIRVLRDFPPEIQPVLTTGRILHSAKGVLRANGLFSEPRLPLPGVFLNGGAAYLPNEILCFEHAFSPETRLALIKLAGVFPQTAFTFFGLSEVHLVNPTPFARCVSKLHYLNAREVPYYELPDRVFKVMVLEEDPELLKAIEAAVKGWDAEMAFSLPYAYEINPPGITKAQTLLALLKAMRLDHLPIYTVGDAENDLSLFQIAKKTFAPATAQQIVIAQTDSVISRKKDGLLAPILSQILG